MKIAGVAKATIPLGVALLLLALFVLHSRGVFPSLDENVVIDNHVHVARRLLPFTASDTPDDDAMAYDYLIIHYHKTGHAISLELTNLIKNDNRTKFNTFQMKMNPFPKREHDEATKCPHSNFQPGIIYVQGAPDFYCNVHVLAEELLRWRTVTKKKGIKIVHLVRNPFPLAVSHYKYHQQAPTPEAWVKTYDVCKEAARGGRDYLDLVMPTLGGTNNGVVMTYEDFDEVLDICNSLFGTRPGIDATFYKHLRKLEPVEGLELATTNLLRGRGGDITRMANNIIKLRQLQDLETLINMSQHQLVSERKIQVLTMAMEEFKQEPKETAYRFFDFILGGSTIPEVKESLATQYEEEYRGKVLNSDSIQHITTGSDKAVLEDHLRHHEFFGRVLGNIEQVVQTAMAENK